MFWRMNDENEEKYKTYAERYEEEQREEKRREIFRRIRIITLMALMLGIIGTVIGASEYWKHRDTQAEIESENKSESTKSAIDESVLDDNPYYYEPRPSSVDAAYGNKPSYDVDPVMPEVPAEINPGKNQVEGQEHGETEISVEDLERRVKRNELEIVSRQREIVNIELEKANNELELYKRQHPDEETSEKLEELEKNLDEKKAEWQIFYDEHPVPTPTPEPPKPPTKVGRKSGQNPDNPNSDPVSDLKTEVEDDFHDLN